MSLSDRGSVANLSQNESHIAERLTQMFVAGTSTQQEALTQLAAFKVKYGQRYPAAVRSLSEDEEHLLTLYAFPQTMHRHIQTTKGNENNNEMVLSI